MGVPRRRISTRRRRSVVVVVRRAASTGVTSDGVVPGAPPPAVVRRCGRRRCRRRMLPVRSKHTAMTTMLVVLLLLLSSASTSTTASFAPPPPATTTSTKKSATNRRRSNTVPPPFVVRSTSRISSSSSDDDLESSVPLSIGDCRNGVRFLGKNEGALVKIGSVLLAPRHEFHHYYRKAAILVYAMGYEEQQDPNGAAEAEREEEGVYVVRGLILDHPTPFTLGEMFDDGNEQQKQQQKQQQDGNPLLDKFVFRGGDKGGKGVILLHKRSDLSGASSIGDSGLYQGGWDAALAQCESDRRDGDEERAADDYKVFFNYCEFTETEIENMLRESTSDEEGDDGWMSVQVDPDLALADYDRGEAWSRFRNAVVQMKS